MVRSNAIVVVDDDILIYSGEEVGVYTFVHRADMGQAEYMVL